MTGAKRCIPREERETIISKADDERTWHVYSCSPSMIRKIRRVAAKIGAQIETLGADGIEVDLPRNAVSFRCPRTKTEGGRAASAQRLADARKG